MKTMKVCAEFFDEDAAIEGHQALLDGGVSPDSIDVRSAYPLPDSIVPPHRSHPMHLRNWVRILWVFGAMSGFGFLTFTQLIWPLHTSGHPLVSLPINFIITYECGMITGLIMTIVFLLYETRHYRDLNPAHEEDFPVEKGNIAIIVDGAGLDKAMEILKSKGAAQVVKFGVALLCLLPFLSGCAVKMRDQSYIKSTETSQVAKPDGTLSMPTVKEQKYPVVKPLGYFHPPQMRLLDKKKLTVPQAFQMYQNPVAADDASVARGKMLFQQNCIFCHGPQGHGDGPVGQAGFMPSPADLTSMATKQKTDGTLFYYITIGPSTMPSFANRLSTQDIFDVINYVRTLQKKG